jgi:shikimate 5-dehydrogenase
MITTENTELVVLLGYPVEHTKSPELFSYFEQEFATKELGWAKQ